MSTQTGADTVNGWIDGLTASGGTNWDRGIYQVAQSGNRFDIAIVITDGNPTFYGNQEGPGNYTRFREVENGIFSANAVKAEATRHDRGRRRRRRERLAEQPHLDLGPDRQQRLLPDHRLHAGGRRPAGAGPRLLPGHRSRSSSRSCRAPRRRVRSPAPCPPAGGSSAPPRRRRASPSRPTSGATASGSGALNFNLTFPGGTTTAPVTVTETQQAGYTLVQQGGFNATCRRLDTNAALTVTNSGAAGFLVTAATAYPVSCTVYNRAPSPGATVVVDKKWVINGQSFDEGQQPLRLPGRAHHRRRAAGLGCGAHRLPAGRHHRAERDRPARAGCSAPWSAAG